MVEKSKETKIVESKNLFVGLSERDLEIDVQYDKKCIINSERIYESSIFCKYKQNE